jgi:hypothetical protein
MVIITFAFEDLQSLIFPYTSYKVLVSMRPLAVIRRLHKLSNGTNCQDIGVKMACVTIARVAAVQEMHTVPI